MRIGVVGEIDRDAQSTQGIVADMCAAPGDETGRVDALDSVSESSQHLNQRGNRCELVIHAEDGLVDLMHATRKRFHVQSLPTPRRNWPLM